MAETSELVIEIFMRRKNINRDGKSQRGSASRCLASKCITKVFPKVAFLYDYTFIPGILEKIFKFVGGDWVIRVITLALRKCTLASCVNRAIIPVTNYCKDVSASRSFPYPFYRPAVADFSIYDVKKIGRWRIAPLTGKYFYGYKFVFAIFHDWKANAEEAFELWIGSQPTSILSNSSLPQPRRQKSCFLWKGTTGFGVFSFRQTSFINLLPDNFLPRVAELALVYSMERSTMSIFSQNPWISRKMFF